MIFTFLLVLLAAGALHRIWLQEEIARPIREMVIAQLNFYQLPFFVKMLSCPPCFAFWSCAVACLIAWLVPLAIIPLALYAALRLALGSIQMVQQLYTTHAFKAPPVPAVTQAPLVTPAPKSLPSCGTCGGKRKVVIFTVFNSFARSYSLVGVALDQARALALQGYSVEFWSTNGSNLNEWPKDMPPGVSHLQIVPLIHWKDDVVDGPTVVRLRDFIRLQVERLKDATIITHDLQFITSYVSFAQALRDVGPTPTVRWLHMAHSRAGARPTHAEGILRSSFMDGHALLYPSPSDTKAMATYYGISEERVWIAPNIRDLATQNRWTPLATKIATTTGLFDADIVQVYPFSTPRAKSKGVDIVIKIFGKLKALGNSVRLVLVNAHNYGEGPQDQLRRLEGVAAAAGLAIGDVVFTGKFPEAADGVSGDVVADLQQVGNVFIFPSTSESCGMVMLEAGINGQLLVLNESLPTMFDAVDRTQALFLPFGQDTDLIPDELIEQAAETIDGSLRLSTENRAKRALLHQYSMEAGGKALVVAVEGVWR
jgi:glycosyltransferase involved in cell wall biosynthesis